MDQVLLDAGGGLLDQEWNVHVLFLFDAWHGLFAYYNTNLIIFSIFFHLVDLIHFSYLIV